MVPEVARRLTGGGHVICVESSAGEQAFISDDEYRSVGIEIAPNLEAMLDTADVICKVQAPSLQEAAQYRQGSALVSFFSPHLKLDELRALTERQITAFSLDLLPRISRAQGMDALSSQSTVSGYRGVLLAAERLPRFFPMLMTAAGTVPPAKVLVLGTGVAGLQAIATSRRLGAVVRAYDIRPSSREEVRSLGASFVELDLETVEATGGYAAAQSDEYLARQRQLIADEVANANVVITTAAVPGRKAPLLVTTSMLAAMAPGSVIVDLAAESGGNCEASLVGEEIMMDNGVLVVGAKDLASSMATHASFLYARNIAEFVALLSLDGKFNANFDDEIIAATCFTRAGVVRHDESLQLMKGLSS